MSKQGKKNDSFGGPNQKPRFDLIPPLAELEKVYVLTHGAIEYGDNNWRLVDHHKERYGGALGRHWNAVRRGETYDPDTGLYHLAHIACDVDFLLEVELDKEPEPASMRYATSPAGLRRKE